jgi:hypothetical protein
VRGKLLTIMGHSNGAAPPEVRREAYARLAQAADAGELTVAVDPMALHQVREAWARLAAGQHHKIVLVP